MSGVWARARADLHPVTADLRRWDKRRPALLLRSFPDDAQNVQRETASTWDEATVETLEEAVGARLGRYGPYIAVAEPGRGVSGGAARDHFQGEEWRVAVQNWMDEAVVIAMVAGWTEGVRWELEQAIARGHVEKLLLVLPGGRHMAERWRHTCKSFSGTPWYAALLSVDTRFALAVHCTSRRVRRRRQPRALGASLHGSGRTGRVRHVLCRARCCGVARLGGAADQVGRLSPTMIDGALVLPDGMVGKMDASATRRPSMPCTRSFSSTTVFGPCPMRQVPMG